MVYIISILNDATPLKLGLKQCSEQHWTLEIEIAEKPTQQAPKNTPIKGFQLYSLQTGDMDLYLDNLTLQWVHFADNLDTIKNCVC